MVCEFDCSLVDTISQLQSQKWKRLLENENYLSIGKYRIVKSR